MSGLSARYDLGTEREDVGRLIGDRKISHGDVGVSFYDVMLDGMGILLDTSREGRASRLVAANAEDTLRQVDTGTPMLIRPDACIAWAGEEHSTAGLEEALNRWFVPVEEELL